MQSSHIREYEQSIGETWDEFQNDLQDNFSLGAVVGLSSQKGFAISPNDWDGYFQNLPLSKSKLKYVHPTNDNDIVDLSETELDYVVGGVAAVPVAAAVIAVVTYAAAAVSVAIAAAIVVVVGASIITHVTVWVTGPGLYESVGVFGN